MRKICLVGLLCILAGVAGAQDTYTNSWGTPTVDGDISDWSEATFAEINFEANHGTDTEAPAAADFSARWAGMNDADTIYVIIEVHDDARFDGDNDWEFDGVDFFFEALNAQDATVPSGWQGTVGWNPALGDAGEWEDKGIARPADKTWTTAWSDDGSVYIIEIAVGMDQLDNAIPAGATTIGFDIKPSDCDTENEADREINMFWGSTAADEDYNNAETWGDMVLAPEPVVVSTIEQDGDAVAAHIGDADLTDGAFTLQHVLGAAVGEDRVVVILVQTETTGDGSDANIPITSVTYDGAAATEATAAYGNPGEQTYRQQTNIFYINDADLPAAAGTYDVTITYGEGTVGDATLAAVAFTGVSQSGPAAAGNDAAPLSTETTSSISMQAYVDGSVAVDVAGGGQNDTTLTVDSAQTELFNIAGASARGAGSTLAIATAGNVSMSYTVGGNMNRYAHSAVLFSPATSGTTVAGITSNISPQFVSVGDNVVLTAPAGSGYVWYKNGDVIDGETDATLELDNIQVEDGGTFKVSYTGDTGAVTTPNLWIPVQAAGEVPVSSLVGLAALMGACGIGGASMLRRRK